MQFLGLDVDEGMIAHAREHNTAVNVAFELLDLTRDETDVRADFAYSVDLLHHVHDSPAFLRGMHGLLRPGASWLAIEPNVFHPYMYVSQERMRRAGFDEDHFRPWVAEPQFRAAGFDVRGRTYALFFPGWFKRVPGAIAWVEPLLERFRLLGASVVYRLVRR